MPTTMTHGPSDVAQWALVALGVAGDPRTAGVEWPVHSDNEPDRPDNCVTVFETTGQGDGRTMDGEIQEHVGLQVRIRASDKRTAYAKANAIRAAMAQTSYDDVIAIPDTSRRFYLHSFSKFGTLIRLANRPNERRHVYVFNCLAAMKQLS